MAREVSSYLRDSFYWDTLKNITVFCEKHSREELTIYEYDTCMRCQFTGDIVFNEFDVNLYSTKIFVIRKIYPKIIQTRGKI